MLAWTILGNILCDNIVFSCGELKKKMDTIYMLHLGTVAKKKACVWARLLEFFENCEE